MGPLRYDGLYLREAHPGLLTWLRFYEEGTVVSVTTTPGPPAQVAGWLRVGHPHVAVGQWAIDGASVSFVTSSEHGAVAYEGEARGDSLSLASHSRINDHRDQGDWTFCALDADADVLPGRRGR